jgi:hypothetical protein
MPVRSTAVCIGAINFRLPSASVCLSGFYTSHWVFLCAGTINSASFNSRPAPPVAGAAFTPRASVPDSTLGAENHSSAGQPTAEQVSVCLALMSCPESYAVLMVTLSNAVSRADAGARGQCKARRRDTCGRGSGHNAG